MLCERCKKNSANIHYTQNINGSKTQIHLCEACAKEKMNVNIDFTSQLGQMFPNMFTLVTGKGVQPQTANQAAEKKCGKCGMSFYEFREKGKLGCENCYRVFEDSVKAVIKRIHGNTEHNGKVTVKAGEEASRIAKIKQLRTQLSQAVENEAYEKAAVLRDEIRTLEGGETYENK